MSKCFHCGDDCRDIVFFDQKEFCCEGCKTVYDILNGSDLTSYYDFEEKNPGIKSNKAFKGKYNFLELEEFRSKLIIFNEGSVSKIKFFLPQIHCSSCLWLLERLGQLAEGVISSQVYFVKKEVEITFNEDEISLKSLAELLASIGYPPNITLEDYDRKRKVSNNKSLIFKIGLTGFCFGNVMLLSFPEYLGINEQDHNFQTIFNYLNLLFSIPVLVFGAKDYIISAYKSLKIKRINIDVPISLGIFALYLRSLYEVVFGFGAGYFDSFIGLIFFLLLGKWFQQQTYSAINFERDYKSYFPMAVTKLVGEEEEIIPLREVEVGDRLLIRNNELIPADSMLHSGNGRIDYSFVSGESNLIGKSEGDKLYAGGRQKGTAIEIEITKKIENSYLTQLWNNPIFNKKTDHETLSDLISRRFTLILIIIAVLAGISWYFIDSSQVAFIVVSILIVACPCAIALSVPFTYGNGMRVMGRKELYLRAVNIIEPFAKVTDIVFDKTGTITQNNLNSISWEGDELDESESSIVKMLTGHSAHPLSQKINGFLKHKYEVSPENYEELPGKGIQAVVNGKQYKIGSKNWLNVNFNDEKTRVCVVVDDNVKGSFIIENSYRSGLEEMCKSLHVDGRKLHILSGDNSAEEGKLRQMLPPDTQLSFNQKPEDKLAYIKSLQQSDKTVMMLGDGLNDAGALQQAEVGVSVVDDVYSFTPSSDAIINGDKLRFLPEFINYCQYNIRVVKFSYAFSLLYNSIGMGFAITGNLKPMVAAILMPLSSISVVLFVTALTSLRGRKLQ